MSRAVSGSGLSLLTPSTLLGGRYQIEQVIGTGGMGAVYSARDLRFRTVVRRCAVKEMHDKQSDSKARDRARQAFEREANLLASLNDPSIPKVFDYFTEGERHYLVYEYVEGQDLARMMAQRDRPFDPERVLEWGIELTSVLGRLHSETPPIIFRDLKPSNIIARPDRRLMLIDFGIAKHFQDQQRGTMIGTEGYAPPEQYEGAANVLVDIYGLGATLHHLLTNTDPQDFRPFSFSQRPIAHYNPTISAGLDSVVTRALSYEAAERWPTMEAFHVALVALREEGAGTSAASPASSTAVSQPTRAPAKGSRLFERHEATRGLSPQPGPDDSPTADFRLGTQPIEGLVEEPSPPKFSKDTRSFKGSGMSGGEETRPIAAAPAQTPVVPPFVQGGAAAASEVMNPLPIWSFASEDEVRSTPELSEEHLYIGSYDSNLYCLDRQSGEFVWKYATMGGIPGTPTVHGDSVIVGSEDQRVYAISRRTGKVFWQAQTQGRVRSSPRIAMDFVVVGSDDGHLYSLRSDRGHLMWKENIGSPIRSTAAVIEDSVFVGAEDGSVVGVELMTGNVLWRVHTGGAVISSPQVMGDNLIVASMDRQVYKIDRRSGWVVWRVRLSDRLYSSPVVSDGLIYAITVDGNLYCLEPDWGREQWKLPLGTQITSSPIIHDGKLFVGGIDGALYAVEMRRKRLLWRFQTGGSIPGSPRVAEDVVYVGSMDHRVYALPVTPT